MPQVSPSAGPSGINSEDTQMEGPASLTAPSASATLAHAGAADASKPALPRPNRTKSERAAIFRQMGGHDVATRGESLPAHRRSVLATPLQKKENLAQIREHIETSNHEYIPHGYRYRDPGDEFWRIVTPRIRVWRNNELRDPSSLDNVYQTVRHSVAPLIGRLQMLHHDHRLLVIRLAQKGLRDPALNNHAKLNLADKLLKSEAGMSQTLDFLIDRHIPDEAMDRRMLTTELFSIRELMCERQNASFLIDHLDHLTALGHRAGLIEIYSSCLDAPEIADGKKRDLLLTLLEKKSSGVIADEEASKYIGNLLLEKHNLSHLLNSLAPDENVAPHLRHELISMANRLLNDQEARARSKSDVLTCFIHERGHLTEALTTTGAVEESNLVRAALNEIDALLVSHLPDMTSAMLTHFGDLDAEYPVQDVENRDIILAALVGRMEIGTPAFEEVDWDEFGSTDTSSGSSLASAPSETGARGTKRKHEDDEVGNASSRESGVPQKRPRHTQEPS